MSYANNLFHKRLLLKNGGFQIFICQLLFLLLSFTKSNAEEDYNLRDFNKKIFQVQDTSLSPKNYPRKYSGLGGAASIRLSLGHHDNLTQAKSWTGPKLRTSNTYWTIYLEAGPGYKSVYLYGFVSGMWPIPRTTVVAGTNQTADLDDQGVLLRVRLFPVQSRVNLTPVLGYSWELNEIARIYDPKGGKPDSLLLKIREHGSFFGTESHFIVHTIRNMPYSKDLRLVFSYLHQSLQKEELNKFRLEFGLFAYEFQKDLKSDNVLRGVASLTISIEHIEWSMGRSDWFVGPSVTMMLIK